MEQQRTDSPVTTIINRTIKGVMIDYYIIMIHCWIPPLQTEEKQSERTDIDGQSQILGSHRPRKQRQWWGWRVLMLQQWWNDAWLIGRKVKGQRAQETSFWDMVLCFYSCLHVRSWTKPFSFPCFQHRKCVSF